MYGHRPKWPKGRPIGLHLNGSGSLRVNEQTRLVRAQISCSLCQDDLSAVLVAGAGTASVPADSSAQLVPRSRVSFDPGSDQRRCAASASNLKTASSWSAVLSGSSPGGRGRSASGLRSELSKQKPLVG